MAQDFDTTIGLSANASSTGQPVDFDGVAVSGFTIYNNSGASIQYSLDGSTWATVANAATASPTISNPSAFRLRKSTSDSYPVPVRLVWSASDNSYNPSSVAITGGKPAMIVAGVIRNFNDGQGWRLITSSDAANHSNLNIASVTSDTTQIYVNFGGSLATNVLSVVATPDETLAQAGFIMGSSVTTSQAIIKLAKYSEIADFVSYSGSAWQSMQGVFGSFSYSAGVLTMTNTAVQTNDKGIVGQATPRGDTYDVGLESLSATQTQLKFFARSGGALATVADANMKAYVSRGTKLYPMDPSTVHEGTYPGGNIWVFGVMQI